MVISKKGVSLPINLIILVVIGLFVFGAVYFGFIKPSQEGSDIFGKQIDVFKDRKFALMDLDTLTHKEKQDACDSNPQAIVDNTISKIDSYIPDNCVLAKSVAERLKTGKVDGCNNNFEIVAASLSEIEVLIKKADLCIETIDKIKAAQIVEEKEVSDSISDDEVYGELYDGILKSYEDIVKVYTIGFENICSNEMNSLIKQSKQNVKELLNLDGNLSEKQFDNINNILAQSRYFEYYCETLKNNCDANTKVFAVKNDKQPSYKYSFENHGNSELPSDLLGEKIKTAYHVTKANCLKDDSKYELAWDEFISAAKIDSFSNLVTENKWKYISLLFEKIFKYVSVDEMEEIYDDGEGMNKIVESNLVGCPEDGIEASEDMKECHNFNEKVLLKFIGPNGTNEVDSLSDALQKETIPSRYKSKFLCYFDSNMGDECDSCVGINSCEDYPTRGSEWMEVCAADPCNVGQNGCYAVDGLVLNYCVAR